MDSTGWRWRGIKEVEEGRDENGESVLEASVRGRRAGEERGHAPEGTASQSGRERANAHVHPGL